MQSPSSNAQQPSPLWEYITIADYHLPTATVVNSAKEKLAVFRRLFQRAEPKQESPLKTTEKLQVLPHHLMTSIMPDIEWNNAAEALYNELEAWLGQEKPEQPLVVLVGPPHSDHESILTALAESHSWHLISPPSLEQILAGDDNWLTDQAYTEKVIVITSLERLYLRHAAGLTLIRRFLDRASSGEFGHIIVGCDSWAWAFINRNWRGRRTATLTLQAADQNRLTTHLQQTAETSITRPILFRQSDNGRYVLPPPGDSELPGEPSDFLQLLSAHSRGILGVARAVWRTSLKTEPDDPDAEKDDPKENQTPHQTVWVTPWTQINQPSMPAQAGRDEAIVLHNLLLHNGLSVGTLQQLLPLSPNQVWETIFRLEEARLVDRRNQDTFCRVTALGYPAARKFLHAQGYLTDQF